MLFAISALSSTGFSINEIPEEDLKRKPKEGSQESCPCLDRDRRWMEDTLSDLCSREGDKRGERKAARLRPADRVICVSCKQTREKAERKRTSEASREENNEWIRWEHTLTSLSPFFFLVWTERDSTSLSNWSTCMFRVSIVFWARKDIKS